MWQMLKINEKDLWFLEKKLASRWTIFSRTLSGWVTQWYNTLYSKSEGFRLESCWCARSYCGNQRYYEFAGGLRAALEIVLWLTSREWGCLFFSDPKLALVQPNASLKEFQQTLHFALFFLLSFLTRKQIPILVLIVFKADIFARSQFNRSGNCNGQIPKRRQKT